MVDVRWYIRSVKLNTLFYCSLASLSLSTCKSLSSHPDALSYFVFFFPKCNECTYSHHSYFFSFSLAYNSCFSWRIGARVTQQSLSKHWDLTFSLLTLSPTSCMKATREVELCREFWSSYTHTYTLAVSWHEKSDTIKLHVAAAGQNESHLQC